MVKQLDIPRDGIKLEDFLSSKKYLKEIEHKRIFYILRPELEKGKILKFGIAGINTGRAVARLREYDIVYGKYSKDNPCTGVRVFAIFTTEYNRLVAPTNSLIQKLELKVKRECRKGDFGSCNKDESGDFRGSERIKHVTPEELIQHVRKLLPSVEDEVTKAPDREVRESTKKYRDDEKAFRDSKTPKTQRKVKKKDETSDEESDEDDPQARSERLVREEKEKEKKEKEKKKKPKGRTIVTRSVAANRRQTRASA